MPANLNALIRYKTINSCLYGGNRRLSIQELMEKCSAALAEYRGRYETVSERTVRDDIRVMRSEILGYNAPITQQKGLYFYSDKNYSIMTISLTDSGLLERIIRFLDEIKTEVAHPELEIILEKLNILKIGNYEEAKQIEEIQSDLEYPENILSIERRKSLRIKDAPNMASESYMSGYHVPLTWADLFVHVLPDFAKGSGGWVRI